MSTERRFFDVLILGGGFAAVWAARRLSRRRGLRIGLVSDQSVMLFHPMLAEVCGASLSPLHIVNPIRRLCPETEVMRASVVDVDFKHREVVCRPEETSPAIRIGYERLLIALGGVVDLGRVPGMAEHGLPLKTVGDAIRIRGTAIDRLERANFASDEAERQRLLTFTVVGGGYSGVEVAGQLADLLQGARKLYPWLMKTPPIVRLVHSGPCLLPQIGEVLGRYAEEKLRERGIEILLNSKVRAVTANAVHLNDRVVDSYTTISTVGNAPHPLVAALGARGELPLDRGRIVTGPDLAVGPVSKVWAAGDCARVVLPDGSAAPLTAQFALREGELAADNILSDFYGRPQRPFTFTGLGELAAIGHRRAVAKILGVKFSGFTAWWLWRTVYLGKLPGLDRKLRVLIDWTLDLLFPRDLSLLRTETTDLLGSLHLEPGDAVYGVGDSASHFYLIKKGLIEIGDEQGAVQRFRPGDHFGERELLEPQPRALSAVAVEPTELVALPKTMFSAIAAKDSEAASLLRETALRQISREELGALLSRVSAERRQKQVIELSQPVESWVMRSGRIRDALVRFRHARASALPILEADGRFSGLLSRERLLEWLRPSGRSPDQEIPEGLVEHALVLEPTDTVSTAMDRMLRTGLREAYVLDGYGKLVGLLDVLDLGWES